MKIDVINMIATPIALAIVLKRRALSSMKSFPGKLSSKVSARLRRRHGVEATHSAVRTDEPAPRIEASVVEIKRGVVPPSGGAEVAQTKE